MLPQAQEYRIAEVTKAGSYTFYGKEILRYKLIFDTGETVIYSRSANATPPEAKQAIEGVITENKAKYGTAEYPTFKQQNVMQAKDEAREPKTNILGTQLYVTWLEANRIEPISPEDFIADFREFQELLKQ